MIKNIATLSLTSLLLIGNFNGCSAKNCDPSSAGFFGGIGCELSGAYDDRLSIFGVQVQIAKDKYLKTLLEYQEMVAQITQDNTQVTELQNNLEQMNNEVIEIEQIIVDISEDEKVNSAKQQKVIKVKKAKLVKKLKTFSKTVERVGKSSVVSSKQKKIVMKKLKSGTLDKKTSIKLKKITENNGAVLAKAESEVLKNTQKTMYMVSSLSKVAQEGGDSGKLKHESVGVILRSKNMYKTKKIHTLETRNKHKSLL